VNAVPSNSFVLGLEHEREEGESEYTWESAWGPGESLFPKQSSSTAALYVQDSIRLWQQLFITLGCRYDIHKTFGGVFTFRIAPALILKTGTKIKATYGTGFKTPSLYQQFAPATAWGPVGNEALNPEKSKGWDAGIEQYLMGDRLIFGLTYFHNDFEDLIMYDWSQGYININRAITRGLECMLTLEESDNFSVRLGYTYCFTQDGDSGEKLLRRPEHKGSLSINYRLSKRLHSHLDVYAVGERIDIYPYPDRTVVPGYTLVNTHFSYQLSKILLIFAKIQNLLDAEYEVVKGYGTPGRSLYLGFKLNI
jgi:vitamin B12 transporter